MNHTQPAEVVLLVSALAAVVSAGRASASFLQRRLRCGWATAVGLIDTLEIAGYITAHRASGRRLTPLARRLETTIGDA